MTLKNRSILCFFLLFALISTASFYGCAQGGAESGQPDQLRPNDPDQDNKEKDEPLAGDPSRKVGKEEKADRLFGNSLARIINNAAEEVVRSFPGARTHSRFYSGEISDVELLMRAKSDFLESIKRNGILNQHNTLGSHSGGTLSPTTRVDKEQEFIHIPRGTLTEASPAEFFPKYGFVSYKTKTPNVQQFSFSTASSYGDIIFVMKPYVRHRTTYTMGDSLGIQQNPRNKEYVTPLSDLTDLLNFHSTGTGPWGFPTYIEYQIWGLMTMHQVREIWVPSGLDYVKMQMVDKIANQYGLKVFEMTDAPSTTESFQAKKTQVYDYSSKRVFAGRDTYLDLAELEKIYPTVTTAWEKAHIESAFAMTKGVKIPGVLQKPVSQARKQKSEGLLKLGMLIPLDFVSAQAHAKTFVDLIQAKPPQGASNRWLTTKTANEFAKYLKANPTVLKEMLKLRDPGALVKAITNLTPRKANSQQLKKVINSGRRTP